MIVLNNGGSQILILELSNENKMIFDFSLPSNHVKILIIYNYIIFLDDKRLLC